MNSGIESARNWLEKGTTLAMGHAVEIVVPPCELNGSLEFLRASALYADRLLRGIRTGTRYLVVSPDWDGDLAILAVAQEIREEATRVLSELECGASLIPGEFTTLIRSFRHNNWSIEDGSTFIHGSLQLPFGEVWLDGTSDFTGALQLAPRGYDIGRTVCAVLSRGVVVRIDDQGFSFLLGKPLVEVGIGCNPALGKGLEKSYREKCAGVVHCGFGASSPIHVFPPFVHVDVELVSVEGSAK